MRQVTAWIFEDSKPIHKFEFSIPDIDEKGFYRTIRSLESFRNRELIRCYKMPYAIKAVEGMRVAIKYEHDYPLSYKVPTTILLSLEAFYKAIGYSKGIRRSKFLTSWKPTLAL